jgi:hypothetical protein
VAQSHAEGAANKLLDAKKAELQAQALLTGGKNDDPAAVQVLKAQVRPPGQRNGELIVAATCTPCCWCADGCLSCCLPSSPVMQGAEATQGHPASKYRLLSGVLCTAAHATSGEAQRGPLY